MAERAQRNHLRRLNKIVDEFLRLEDGDMDSISRLHVVDARRKAMDAIRSISVLHDLPDDGSPPVAVRDDPQTRAAQ